ncbi:MAG: acyl-CoA thioesterase [Acidobacteriota bacterium]|nr:MAG: acyl-CoA thioesterase [Acidobacteriota bacterium]
MTERPDTYVDARMRVRYAETDQMGVAYYSNYLVWFEVGRTEYCRARGFAYSDLEEDNETFLPVVEANCRYLKPLLYDREFVVRTRVKTFRRRFLAFTYEVFSADLETLHAEGETKHVFTGPDGRPKSLPEEFHRFLQ